MKRIILLIDAVINFILGGLLLVFTNNLASWLGVPESSTRFYPTILGAVLVGIGAALIVEFKRKADGLVGLGLGGAVSINLCAGVVLSIWLIFGKLSLPLKGYIFLGGLVVVLIVISSIEIFFYSQNHK